MFIAMTAAIIVPAITLGGVWGWVEYKDLITDFIQAMTHPELDDRNYITARQVRRVQGRR